MQIIQDRARGVTVVSIDIDGVTFVGSSKTAPEDRFNPETGRQIALARALRDAARIKAAEAEGRLGEPIFSQHRGN